MGTNALSHRALFAFILLLAGGLCRPAWALSEGKGATWNRTTKAMPDAEAGGWFINLGLTGARAKIPDDEPKILEVMFVFKDAPAHGKLEVDPKLYRATHDFVVKGTNPMGYVWYKDGNAKNPKYADMGRTGAAALAHYLSLTGGSSYRAYAKRAAQCIGDHPKTYPDTHGSPLLGMAWTALGAAVDPPSLRKLLDHNRWHFALSHCLDGTFYYQPNRDNNPQDYAADPRLCSSAATALILSLKHRRLQMTGAKLITRE